MAWVALTASSRALTSSAVRVSSRRCAPIRESVSRADFVPGAGHRVERLPLAQPVGVPGGRGDAPEIPEVNSATPIRPVIHAERQAGRC